MLSSEAQQHDSIEWLNKRCWDMAYSQPDSAIYFGKKAKIAAIREKNTHEAIRSDILVGIVYDVKAQYDSAMLYYHQALRTAQIQKDTTLIASCLSNIGLTFWHIGSYYKALENLFSSLNYFQTLSGNVPQMASVYNNIGLIYSELADYNKALGYFKRSKQLYLKNNDTLGWGAVTTNKAIVLYKQGLIDKALQTLDSSIAIKKIKNDYYGLAIAYNEKASVSIENGRHDEAYRFLEKSLQYSKKINDLNAQAITYQILQKVFLKEAKYDKAIRYNQIAFDIANQINDQKLVVNHYRNLSKIYEAMGNYHLAHEYFVKYAMLKDSLINEKQLSNIYQLEFQHQLDRQQNEIAMLQERQEIQSLRIERQELLLSKRNLQMIIVIGASVIFLLVFYVQYIRARHRHKREIVMTTMQQKSRQAQKIIQAELNERKRISQEIHDSLGQLLSLIKMNLASSQHQTNYRDERMTKKIDNIMGLVDHAIVELRNISQNMSPIMLREKGLTTALEDMVQRLRNVSSIDIKLELLDIDALDDELIENIAFSVVQESLNNAIKHSKCSRIDIQVVYAEGELTVMVEDNGKGFVQEEVQNGLGLSQIRTKVQNIGGNIEIDSMPGRGTIVTIEIPTKKIFEI
ncbi:MAG: tetratricopeptide repeat protein [Bacteroidales bacterium]